MCIACPISHPIVILPGTPALQEGAPTPATTPSQRSHCLLKGHPASSPPLPPARERARARGEGGGGAQRKRGGEI
jgi:hypothetical protein